MKNVVVAGGTTGMGREIARHYLRPGARVTVVGITPARGEQFLRGAEPGWMARRRWCGPTCCRSRRTSG